MTRPDLNLLTSLHALLTYQSVSGAASQLGLSQPTLSAALAKLRLHYGDPLLVRRDGRYHLTVLGQELAPRVARALQESERALSVRSDFDPLTSDRHFRVQISDYAISVLGPGLIRLFEAQAPRAALRLELLGPMTPEVLESVDGVVLPLGAMSDQPHIPLFGDRWVCVMNAQMGSTVDEVSVEFLRSARTISVLGRPGRASTALRRLALLGIEDLSQVSVDSYLAAPFLLEASQSVALMPERAATRFASAFDIAIKPCDFLGEGFFEAFWWSYSHDSDAGHRWFRDLLAAAALPLDPSSAASSSAPPAL